MKVRFVYARFNRHADDHPELRVHVPANEYFGPPSLGIAMLAASTPGELELDFRDDRLEDVGLDDADVDLVAISCFTPSSMRAMELADAFRARGKKVVMGGIFPTMMPEVVAPHCDAVIVGEGEGVWPEVLRDARDGTLKPVYRESAIFDPSKLPLPRVDLYMEKEGRTFCPDDYPVQVARGCPLSCDACVLPTVMGKKLRALPVAHVLGQIEQLGARGKLGSFTEDTSFFLGAGGQRHFGEILDALAARGGAGVSYVGISMPMILATSEAFFARMRAAGVKMFYLVGGFDPITQNAFTGKDPKAYARALAAVRKAIDLGVEPYTSFLVGNDGDDEGSFDRMLELADATKIHKAEFAVRTPYPGTPAWVRLLEEGRILHRDFSRYNDANVVFRPAQMTPERLQEGYLYLWREFYKSRQALRGEERVSRTVQF